MTFCDCLVSMAWRMTWVSDITSHPQADWPSWALLSAYVLYRNSVWRKDQYPNSPAFNMHLKKLVTAPCSKLPWFLSVLKPKGVEFICIRQWYPVALSSDCFSSSENRGGTSLLTSEMRDSPVDVSWWHGPLESCGFVCWSLRKTLAVL